MKIIGISNFNLDNVSDILVCENIDEAYGEHIVNYLNDIFIDKEDNSIHWYKLVENDYKLKENN